MGHRGLRHLHHNAGFTRLCKRLHLNRDKLYLSVILSQNAFRCEVYAFQEAKIVICMTVNLAAWFGGGMKVAGKAMIVRPCSPD
jgi:hypothetical protein